MAVKSRDDLLKAVADRFGDDTSDETIAMIEDITDTINDYEEKTKDSTDWKKKYEENDEAWRKKYKDRFFQGEPNNNPNEGDPNKNTNEDDAPVHFSDLFSTK